MSYLYRNNFYQKGSTSVLLTVLVAIIALAAMYFYMGGQYTLNRDDSNAPAVSPVEEAENVFLNSGAEASRPLFEKALETSQSSDEEQQIVFRLAAIDGYSEDIKKQLIAIDAFRKIATNANYTDYIRANSLEFIGRIYSRKTDPIVFKYIFDHPDYKKFLVKNDNDESLKNLYEYASSFYPTAQTELRIATWYAREILSIQKNPVTADQESTIKTMKALITKNLENADRDAEVIRTQKNDDSRLLDIDNRKATVIGYLYQGGDKTYGDPEVLYKKVLKQAIVEKNISQLGFTRFYYASFLADTYGTERIDDIKSLLSDFYASDLFKDLSVLDFFKNAKALDADNFVRVNLVTLSKLDSDFKALLIKLGWQL